MTDCIPGGSCDAFADVRGLTSTCDCVLANNRAKGRSSSWTDSCKARSCSTCGKKHLQLQTSPRSFVQHRAD
uniref:Uncharacterized protein n=1 Tax=Peronospora matthiolae TaxID=2874970 RepID=A0AAV1V0G1_9STRA